MVGAPAEDVLAPSATPGGGDDWGAAPSVAPSGGDDWSAPAPNASVGGDEWGAPAPQAPVGGDDFGGVMGGSELMGGSGDLNAMGDMGMAPPAPMEPESFDAPPPMTNGISNGAPMGLDAANFASSALAEWKAAQQAAIAEKEEAEKRELQSIREEAQAERDLMYSQRQKQLQAVYKNNREKQAAADQVTASQTGWEAVLNLLSDENLVPDKHTDLSRFKQMLVRLKHQRPLTTM